MQMYFYLYLQCVLYRFGWGGVFALGRFRRRGGVFQKLCRVWMGGLDEFRVRIHTYIYLHMHLAHVYAECLHRSGGAEHFFCISMINICLQCSY